MVEDRTRISGNLEEILSDRYKIICPIGQGGMGSVYKAFQINLEKIVAIKIVSPHLMSDDFVRSRFDAEVRALSKLQHPNLINIIDVGARADGCPFYVMDYIDGMPLDKLIKEHDPMPLKRAVPIFKQIASALGYAHSKGIIHRDIKPSNIMLSHEDFAKVIDLGIAKIILSNNTAAHKLTTTGEVFGSPIYMSPEQGSGGVVDARADIYSLGCLMFEVLTGRPPIVGETPIETVIRHLNVIPSLVSSQLPNPAAPGVWLIDEIVARCLEKNPDNRYPSAFELVRDLECLEAELRGKSSGRQPKAFSAVQEQQNSHKFGMTPSAQASKSQLSDMTPSISRPVDGAKSAGFKPSVPKPASSPATQPAGKNFTLNLTESTIKKGLIGVVVGGVFLAFVIAGLANAVTTAFMQNRFPSAPAANDGVSNATTYNGPVITVPPASSFGRNREVTPEALEALFPLYKYRYPADPAKVPIYYCCIYTAVSPAKDANGKLQFQDVDVQVTAENRPMILVLKSYMPMHWHIKPVSDKVKIERAVVIGYHPVTVDGLAQDVLTSRIWYRGLDENGDKTNRLSAQNDFEKAPRTLFDFIIANQDPRAPRLLPRLNKFIAALEEYTGGSLAELQSRYSNRKFTVPMQ